MRRHNAGKNTESFLFFYFSKSVSAWKRYFPSICALYIYHNKARNAKSLILSCDSTSHVQCCLEKNLCPKRKGALDSISGWGGLKTTRELTQKISKKEPSENSLRNFPLYWLIKLIS